MDFVGIILDIPKYETHLPEDKLVKSKCTLKEMQSLIGVLNFACSVVQPGRAFKWRMIT